MAARACPSTRFVRAVQLIYIGSLGFFFMFFFDFKASSFELLIVS